jgi:hypothetical protein
MNNADYNAQSTADEQILVIVQCLKVDFLKYFPFFSFSSVFDLDSDVFVVKALLCRKFPELYFDLAQYGDLACISPNF